MKNENNKLDILIVEIKKYIESENDYGLLKEKTRHAGLSLYTLHKLIEKIGGETPSSTDELSAFVCVKESNDCGGNSHYEYIKCKDCKLKKSFDNFLFWIIPIGLLFGGILAFYTYDDKKEGSIDNTFIEVVEEKETLYDKEMIETMIVKGDSLYKINKLKQAMTLYREAEIIDKNNALLKQTINLLGRVIETEFTNKKKDALISFELGIGNDSLTLKFIDRALELKDDDELKKKKYQILERLKQK